MKMRGQSGWLAACLIIAGGALTAAEEPHSCDDIIAMQSPVTYIIAGKGAKDRGYSFKDHPVGDHPIYRCGKEELCLEYFGAIYDKKTEYLHGFVLQYHLAAEPGGAGDGELVDILGLQQGVPARKEDETGKFLALQFAEGEKRMDQLKKDETFKKTRGFPNWDVAALRTTVSETRQKLRDARDRRDTKRAARKALQVSPDQHRLGQEIERIEAEIKPLSEEVKKNELALDGAPQYLQDLGQQPLFLWKFVGYGYAASERGSSPIGDAWAYGKPTAEEITNLLKDINDSHGKPTYSAAPSAVLKWKDSGGSVALVRALDMAIWKHCFTPRAEKKGKK